MSTFVSFPWRDMLKTKPQHLPPFGERAGEAAGMDTFKGAPGAPFLIGAPAPLRGLGAPGDIWGWTALPSGGGGNPFDPGLMKNPI